MEEPPAVNSVCILGQFARPARGYMTHLHRVETAAAPLYAISTLPNVLHLVEGTMLKCTIHVEEAIVDVASIDGSVVIAGDVGSIWQVPLPRFSGAKPITIALSSRDDEGKVDTDALAAYGQTRHVRANRKRPLDAPHEKGQHGPVHCVPGTRSISCLVESGLSVVFALSVLVPTTALSLPRKNEVERREYDALDGEMATCMLLVSNAGNKAGHLNEMSGDRTSVAVLLFQGDRDGQVRVVALDSKMTVVSQPSTFWCFKNQRVYRLFGVSWSSLDAVDAIAIVGTQGRLVVVGSHKQIKWDVQLHSPIDWIEYDRASKQFVYIVHGRCYRRSLTSPSTACVPLGHIPHGVAKVALGSDRNELYVLQRSGRVFSTCIQPHEGETPFKRGTESALKAEVAKITQAEFDMHASGQNSSALSKAIDKANSTRKFLRLCQVKGIRTIMSCKVSVTSMGRDGRTPCGRPPVLEISIQVDRTAAPALRLTDWRVLVVLREPTTKTTHQFTYVWPALDVTFVKAIAVEPFKMFCSGVSNLKVQCYLVHDDRPLPFHFTLLATSLNALTMDDGAFTAQNSPGHMTKWYTPTHDGQAQWWMCYDEYRHAFLGASAGTTPLPPTSMNLAILPGPSTPPQPTLLRALSALHANDSSSLKCALNDLTIKRVDRARALDALHVSLYVVDSSSLAAIRGSFIAAALGSQEDGTCIGLSSPVPNARELFPGVSALGATWVSLREALLPSFDFDGTSQKEILWLVGQVLRLEHDLSTLYWSSRKVDH
ncbi:hypothetical protein H310_08573 [Aphanomyces invadans]|uniref:Uncharacterized protein n=1 Tax=Aphanomyces invadans TaxID=157072 RepID=A0A024TXS3_9STRA|nr:hypothetical protein H310_08573 [Aphanomyces invadans]ETV98406.1 hypothetical protein H310_08573 [Aphanomyces invadans]|eukprot:XP_008872603.1 hypothetical protein H310_08573 [Aphanomyces invadans]